MDQTQVQVPEAVLPFIKRGRERLHDQVYAHTQLDEYDRTRHEQFIQKSFPKTIRSYVVLRDIPDRNEEINLVFLDIPGLAPMRATIYPLDKPQAYGITDKSVYMVADYLQLGNNEIVWVWETRDMIINNNLDETLALARERFNQVEMLRKNHR